MPDLSLLKLELWKVALRAIDVWRARILKQHEELPTTPYREREYKQRLHAYNQTSISKGPAHDHTRLGRLVRTMIQIATCDQFVRILLVMLSFLRNWRSLGATSVCRVNACTPKGSPISRATFFHILNFWSCTRQRSCIIQMSPTVEH